MLTVDLGHDRDVGGARHTNGEIHDLALRIRRGDAPARSFDPAQVEGQGDRACTLPFDVPAELTGVVGIEGPLVSNLRYIIKHVGEADGSKITGLARANHDRELATRNAQAAKNLVGFSTLVHDVSSTKAP
jgi:hypothetical protein